MTAHFVISFADAGDWFVSAGGQPTPCRVTYRDQRAGSEPTC